MTELTFWQKAKVRHIETEKRRSIHQLRIKPEYIALHPQEAKSNPDKKILQQCHPNIAKQIEETEQRRQAKALVPSTITPKRLNRS